MIKSWENLVTDGQTDGQASNREGVKAEDDVKTEDGAKTKDDEIIEIEMLLCWWWILEFNW